MNTATGSRPESAPEEAAEVMRCLRESLRDPTFAAVLALLVLGNAEEGDFGEHLAPSAEAK